MAKIWRPEIPNELRRAIVAIDKGTSENDTEALCIIIRTVYWSSFPGMLFPDEHGEIKEDLSK